MYGLENIRRMSQEATEQTEDRQLVPFHPLGNLQIDCWPPVPFPNLGRSQPDGWEEDEDTRWLCDSSGFGDPDEPACTIQQLKQVVKDYLQNHPDAGFGIIEEGQFQVVVSAFNPV